MAIGAAVLSGVWLRAEMIQRDETFLLRVLAITRGSTADFPNADPFFHNVFSLSRAATFDRGRYPRNDVCDHPYFTTPSGDGRFAIADVPAGDLRLSAWHERIGESSKDITVDAGRTTRVEFALHVEDGQ